jgi:DedD protein
MDRALKERITGAVVLVVIAVLVVPVFLDGAPTDAEIVTQTVTLPGQEEQRRKQQTIVLERDRDQPVPAGPRRDTPGVQSAAERSVDTAAAPAAAQASVPPAAAQPQPEPQAPAEKDESSAPVKEEQQEATRVAHSGAGEAAPAAAKSESATGMWAVQLGSFSNPDNAQRLASELRANGYAAFLSQLKTPDGSLHRVRVGPQKDRDSAEAVAKRLGGDGHAGQVVPHP